MTSRTLLCCITSLVVLACTTDGSSAGSPSDSAADGAIVQTFSTNGDTSFPSYQRQANVAEISLEPTQWVRLGPDGEGGSPLVVNDIVVRGDTLYVLDPERRRISAYRRNGTFLWMAGERGANLGQMERPQRFAIVGDTLYVADARHVAGISLWSTAGQYVRSIRLAGGPSPFSVAVAGGNIFVSVVDPERTDSTNSVVIAYDAAGRSIGRGCPRHPKMRKSVAESGLLSIARSSYVAGDGNVVYCYQTITPVVHGFDATGRLADVISIAPPFYVDPTDQPLTSNEKQVSRFQAGWAAQTRFLPMSGGFTSVYVTTDTLAGASRFKTFSCDTFSAQRECTVGSGRHRPIAMVHRDSLLLLNADDDGSTVRVGVVNVRGRRGR